MRTTHSWHFTIRIGVLMLMSAAFTHSAEAADTSHGDEMIAAYFRAETQKLSDAYLANVKTFNDWTSRRAEYRQQLREMLGLDPLPERTPLNTVVTGKLQRDDFAVEKLYFQSRPHLYVTANLYLPKNGGKPAPTILYLCGHSIIKKNGISYGSKASFQNHGAWFARNGYVCLVIDTLERGEIEGTHHGTYSEGMWWWNARGYTPAGVEAWNSIRAVDYLLSRPEVDANRIGVTGRSGGGAYSWYLAALDDRIKVAVPVAGITTLENHVVDGCVEGHCDCMYPVNTYRWDFAQLAALAAPRPLLISNTDRDTIFPLDGVVDIYQKVRQLYEMDNNGPDIALQIAAGPHADGQVLQLHAMQWFDKHFKGQVKDIETVAKDFFSPEELKVFDKPPADETNTRIHETFVPLAAMPTSPNSHAEWVSQRDKLIKALREKCFRGWPDPEKELTDRPPLRLALRAKSNNAQLIVYDFDSQPDIELRLYVLLPAEVPTTKLKSIELEPLDDLGWSNFLSAMQPEFAAELRDELRHRPQPRQDTEQIMRRLTGGHGLAFVAPRGIGPTAWTSDPKECTHIRRRFMLLGQTLDGMRVWDVRRAIQTLRSIDGLTDVPLSIRADREIAGVALYAALFEPRIEHLQLRDLSLSHRTGPDFLNVLRFLDIPQTVAMVAEKSQIDITHVGAGDWEYPRAVANKLGWGERIRVINTPENPNANAGNATK
jgi:dienelactone hydrolase